MNFRSFLIEAPAHLARVNVTKFDLDALLECHKNAGYKVGSREREFFHDSFYEGFKNGAHSFIVLIKDEDPKSQEFYLSRFTVTLDESGVLVAHPGNKPLYPGLEAEVYDKFKDMQRLSVRR